MGKSRALHLLWEQWIARTGGHVLVLDLTGDATDPTLPEPSKGLRVFPDHIGDAFAFVDAWCTWLFEFAREQRTAVMLVVDETHLCLQGTEAPPELVRLVTTGRKKDISWALGTQRWVQVPPVLRSCADELYVFKMRDSRDLEEARKQGLGNLDPDVLRRLDVGDFVHTSRHMEAHHHHGVTSPCNPPAMVPV